MRIIYLCCICTVIVAATIFLVFVNKESFASSRDENVILELPFEKLILLNEEISQENIQSKILYYVDASSCSECSLRVLHSYEDQIKKFGLPMIVIIKSSKEQQKRIKYYLKSMKLHSTVFVDTNNIIDTRNECLSSNSVEIYLLNKENLIIAKGNPLFNKSVMRTYVNEISKLKY